ncbi:MAG: carboxypeptidase regulatory-like domain-containing protein [Vicinamibacterales bacterium]
MSSAPGSIAGFIHDERGEPVANVVVSILGAITTVTVTDEDGRFEFGTLTPGPYLLRAHVPGYVAPGSQVVHVRASARATSSVALRREGTPPVLMAGIGAGGLLENEPAAAAGDDSRATAASAPATRDDNHSETAWRIRHGRRGILKDATLPESLLADLDDDGDAVVLAPLGKAIGTPAKLATAFFSDTDFSGQLNLLTAGSFETPEQLFSGQRFARSVANVRLGAPVGQRADWTVAGALTEADVSSWVVAGSYSMRAPARHRYDVGMSYSTQRYAGGNPLALRNVTDGSRNAGSVYAYDSFSVSPSTTVSFGTEYARYDYVDQRGLLSPRVELTMSPTPDLRVVAGLSQRAMAPGAQEFMLPGDTGVWLPPQRTFSSLERDGRFQAERTLNARVGVERDLRAATVGIRAFRQRVNDQVVTVFGAAVPGQPSASVGHYLVGNTGDIDVNGCTAEVRAVVASRIHGSVEYSLASARILRSGNAYLMLVAPVTGLPARRDIIQDVRARLETEVPETATRFLLVYRVSNAFARPSSRGGGQGLGSRFDVQVRQSLPFMNFTSARWEMLLAVRNFFHDGTIDQSLYDELLVVRPPKRVVGGVTLHF